MSYINQSAAPGEQIIGVANFSWLYLCLTMMPFWIGLVLAYFGLHAIMHNAMLAAYVPQIVLNYGFIAILVVGVVHYMLTAMPWISVEIAATTHRVVYSHGIITRRTEEVSINRLEGVKLNQTFLGRIFNFGSLAIYGVGMDEIILPPINNPMEFRKAVQEAVNMSQASDAGFLGGK